LNLIWDVLQDGTSELEKLFKLFQTRILFLINQKQMKGQKAARQHLEKGQLTIFQKNLTSPNKHARAIKTFTI
jgi:hypothetical protein